MSGFLNDSCGFESDRPSDINFDTAVRLPGGGSTCDIFRTRWQRRDVFVKRLKEELRSKPIYLDALDKEFDIGVTLNHPSLPQYREFGGDYIVMDYIDGMTLADMIQRNDPWLADEKHIVRLLRELVEVVDYLHRHNVVHCDIKPDNIILTANGKNLVLIDFDKSYTDALSDTSGHPGKYGLPSVAKGRFAIDFNGIGMIAQSLKANVRGFKFSRYRRFVKTCFSADADCEKLTAILAYSPSGSRIGAISAAVGICVVAGLGLIYFLKQTDANPEQDSVTDSVVVGVPGDSAMEVIDEPAVAEPTVNHPVAPAQAPSVAATVADEQGDIEERFAILCYEVEPLFNELITELNRLDSLKSDTAQTRNELLEHWNRYSDLNHKNIGVVMDKTRSIFFDVSLEELGNYLSATPGYKQYTSRYKEVTEAYHHELDRRLNR